MVVGIGNKYIRLVTVYQPPPVKKNNTSTGMFFEEFSLLLEELVISTSPLLICGDCNIHMDDGLNTNTNNFKDLLTSVGLMQNVCNSTHKRGHILDLLITRVDEELLSSLNFINNTSSDHAAITCKLELPRPLPSKRVITFRNLRNIDMDSFRSDLKSLVIYNLNLDDPDKIVYHYNADLSDLLDMYAPECTHMVTLRPHPPWFNDSLRKLKTEKRRLEHQWMKSGLEID